MKILFCIFAVFGCSYIGFGMSKNFKRKTRLYEDLVVFCGKIKSDIGYFGYTVSQILNNGMKNRGDDFCLICQKVLKRLSLPQSLLTLDDIKELSFVSDEEKSLICDFFCLLGKTDAKEQSEQSQVFEKIFFEKLEASKEEYKTKGSLYGKLGIYAGLFVALLCL